MIYQAGLRSGPNISPVTENGPHGLEFSTMMILISITKMSHYKNGRPFAKDDTRYCHSNNSSSCRYFDTCISLLPIGCSAFW